VRVNIKSFFYSLSEMSKLPPAHRQSMEEATAEAEARPLDYDPASRAKYIRAMLRDIASWMSNGDSEAVIREKAKDFIEQYPELFKKIIARQDLSPIQQMLSMMDKMAQGSISQHQASVAVGKKLVDKYVTPSLNGNAERK
jgi:hypothetical protein